MSEYVLQVVAMDGFAGFSSDDWSESAFNPAVRGLSLTEAWAVADKYNSTSDLYTYRVAEKVSEYTEAPRPEPQWEVGKVYRFKVGSDSPLYRVTSVDEDGYALIKTEKSSIRGVFEPGDRMYYVEADSART